MSEEIKFTQEGTFEAYRTAVHWLEEKGFDVGSMSSPLPTAVMYGDYDNYDLPWKMKNFTASQKKQVHGLISGNFREGPVLVTLYGNHPTPTKE